MVRTYYIKKQPNCCKQAGQTSGEAFPLMNVFPKTRYKEEFLNGAPPGSIPLTIPSGWMTKEGFLDAESNKVEDSLEATDLPSTSLLAVQTIPEIVRPFPKAQNVKKGVTEKKKISEF
ncbi:hypothetical protein ILUMI_23911 [Ignelater luminosus]|uniref:Uncharacterized protein n=1 Tax=Ignelater luminosus TaxID=2038154 RepID=A0A8K0FZ88_IGNLU|nr:hypothetical protein ILUMI_23911 [Ignelater luminosus]